MQTYWIDRHNTIVLTLGRWDQGAKGFGILETGPGEVLGTSVWDHLQGEALRQSLRCIFFAVRAYKQPFRLPWIGGCHGHGSVIEMTVTPLSKDALKVSHDIARGQIPGNVERGGAPGGDQAFGPAQTAEIATGQRLCSVCCGTAASPFSSTKPDSETGGALCGSCRKRISQALDDLAARAGERFDSAS